MRQGNRRFEYKLKRKEADADDHPNTVSRRDIPIIPAPVQAVNTKFKRKPQELPKFDYNFEIPFGILNVAPPGYYYSTLFQQCVDHLSRQATALYSNNSRFMQMANTRLRSLVEAAEEIEKVSAQETEERKKKIIEKHNKVQELCRIEKETLKRYREILIINPKTVINKNALKAMQTLKKRYS
jgi:hypothetical protein